MILNYLKKKITNNHKFFKNSSSVLLSSVLVQLIPFIILPVITRKVTEDTLGIYIFWISISVSISILMSFKLDMAIFIASNYGQAKKLVQSITVTSIFIGIIVFIVNMAIIKINIFSEKYQTISPFIELLIINSVFSSIFQGLSSFLIFNSDFKKYNISRIIQAFCINIFVVLIVLYYSHNELHIIIAHTFGTVISTFFTYYLSKVDFIFKDLLYNTLSDLKEYKRFPIYSLPAEFINNFTNNIPYIFILSKYDPIYLAYYSLIIKALSAPIGLIGSSMLTIFKEEASIEIREYGNCRRSYNRVFKLLTTFGVISFSFLLVFSPQFFSILFGDTYKPAGELARFIIPLFLFKFIFSPLSYTLFATNKQNIDLIWQVILFIGVGLIFIISSDFYVSIYLYVIFYSMMYIINFLITKKLSLQNI